VPSIVKTAQCIGLSGRVSIRRDFFGYWTALDTSLSLRAQVRLLQGKHIHLNLIRTAVITAAHSRELDYALQTMRRIYATVNIGIGRVRRYNIPPGREVIDGKSAAHDLWNAYGVDNDGIDVFLAASVVGNSVGMAPEDGGSCDKSSKDDSGCVIGLDDNADGVGVTMGQALAHEVGHFLGLEHEDGLPDNLMFPTVPNGGKLYGGQGGAMVLHCAIRGGCRS